MVVMATIIVVATVVVKEVMVVMATTMVTDTHETMIDITMADLTTTALDTIDMATTTGIVMTTGHMEVTREEDHMIVTGTTEIGHMTEVGITAEMIGKRMDILLYRSHVLGQHILIEPGHEKMFLMSYTNIKGTGQPAHPLSLISAFVVRCLDSIISLDSIAKISRP